MQKEKIGPLTSLRFFAAIFVVLGHTFVEGAVIHPAHFAGNLLSVSFIAVGFFFVLSGYILSHVYLRSGAPVDRKRFWWSRFARIYPLYLASLVLDLPSLISNCMISGHLHREIARVIVTFLGNGAMLQVWWIYLRQVNNPSWSLAVEAVFYLLFPLVCVRLWKIRPSLAPYLGAGMYIAGLSLTLVAERLHVDQTLIMYNPVFHLHEFFAGVLLARWHFSALDSDRLKKALTRVAPWLMVTAMFLLVIVTAEFNRIPLLLLKDGLLVPLYALLIVSAASRNPLIDRMLSIPVLVTLGEASYGMYLLHIPFWHLLLKVTEPFGGIHTVPRYLAYVGLVIGASVLIFYQFEAPVRRWILNRRPTKALLGLTELVKEPT